MTEYIYYSPLYNMIEIVNWNYIFFTHRKNLPPGILWENFFDVFGEADLTEYHFIGEL